MLRKLAYVSITAMLAGLPAIALAAPGPSDGEKSKSEFPAEKVKKALDKVVDLDITDQALATAVTTLRDKTKLNFVLDFQTLINFVGDPNTLTVSAHDKNAKLKTSLREMLAPYHMSYVILGDSVVITTEDVAMQRQMRQRVNLDLDAVPFADAVKLLARETGTNLMVDTKVKKDAETAVTLQLEDVPLETAIRLLSESVGLKPVRMGNVLYVTSKANAKELRSDPDLINGQPGGPAPNPPPAYGVPDRPAIGAPALPPVVVPEVPPPAEDKKKDEKPEK
jgi:type II secretory pathway component GspD/PulD (secretin)